VSVWPSQIAHDVEAACDVQKTALHAEVGFR